MNTRHPLNQALASALAALLFLNPLVATAAQLAVDAAAGGNTSLGAAGNGVPIVNIATPNGSGLSHNRFESFNVGQQGLILNNATGKTASTQLGGIVLGNPNLRGQAAQKILNEVTSGSPAQLRGYTEVAGQGAHVIVAAPGGVTCSGCGFINTPRVTLTTGKPILASERLQGYDVDGGAISIEGAELNAGNVDQFELITRSAKLNADLYAKQLSVVAGRNQVDAETLAATAKPEDGSARPQLAIDSSALGGMYANSIRLVGTEAGVGVKLAGNMAASAGDIRIDANGKLELAQASASADLSLKGQDVALSGPAYAGGSASVQATGALSNAQSLAAGSSVQLSAASLSNSGVIEAGVSPQGKGDLSITARTLRNTGSLIASRNLNASAATLDNRNGRIGGQLIRISGDSLDNRQGLFAAGQGLTFDLDHLDNREQGLLSSRGQIDGRVGALDNQAGSLFANGRVAISGGDFFNAGGQVSARSIDFSLRGALDNSAGLIEAADQLTLAAASLNNDQGRLRALGPQGTTRITTSGLLDNRNGSLESAAQSLLITSGSLLNDGGSVRHLGSGDFGLDLAQAGLAGGSFISNGSLSYQASRWTNASLIQARDLSLDIGQLTQTASGQLLASSTFNGTGGDWNNAGTLAGGTATRIDLSGQLDNSGRLTSDGDLNVRAASLNNHGTLGSGANLRVETPTLLNENGLIFSGADMTLRVGSFTNRFADVFSLGALDLAADDAGNRAARLDNLSATLESQGDMRLSVSALNNARAVLVVNDAGKYTAQIVEVNCYKYLNDSIADCSGKRNGVWEITERDKLDVLQASAASSISAGGDLRIDADLLSNTSSQIAAGGDLYATVRRLSNQGVVTGESETFRVFVSQRTNNMGSWRDEADAFSDRYWYLSPNYVDDPAGLVSGLSHFLARTERELTQYHQTTQLTQDSQTYAAIIQAAGNVEINASELIDNSVIRNHYSYVNPGDKTLDTGVSTPLPLNPQLPPDQAQQAVDPLSLPGFQLPQGNNGLFHVSPPGQAYLIETNPALTGMKHFLGSDYLLGLLGYDPAQAQKRLGDGLYEQRLIQQAVVARTGQRYIDGIASDEALFKYLMDNAIAYKDSLDLTLGVALSAEQVAALTHDIVWLQDQVVNGEHVLVPVLYLAQAKHRLAPNGALIQGRDVSLISGGGLNNQGTLRASHDLSATALNIGNSGLLEANRRLQLLATDSIRNAQGGVIKGRDLSLTALTGDVINERSVTRIDSAQGKRSWTASFADSAARIEADNDLTISAGRDLNNIGGVLKAGNDLSLSAGRDLNLNAAQTTNGQVNGSRHRDQQIEQLGGEVSAGRDLDLNAGRDLTATASHLGAGRDAALSAGRDVTLSSAANESHSYSKTKKITAQHDHVEQQGTTLTAGGDVTVSAGENLTLKASKIGAGNEAYLVAGDKLELLADYDSDYSLYDKKSKGSFGSKKTRRDEVTDVKAIGSQISAGGDLTLLSGGDQKYQGATLESGHDIALVSGGEVTFEVVKDLHQESHEKSSVNLAWQSAKGKGQTDETLRQSQLVAQGELAIRAVDGLNIDLKQIDRKNVSQTINAMVQADPNLAWLKDAEARGDVDWRRVKEVHDSFKYSNSGMGPAAQLAVAIVVSVMTYGAASAAIGAGATAGSAMSAGVAATATTDAVAAGWANVALASASSSLASTGAVSTINNKGDLGAALKDTLSSDSLRQAMIAGAVGGLTTGYFDDLAGTKTKFVDGKVVVDLSSANGVASFAANQALQNLTSAALNKAAGGPANFGDALKDSLYNTLAAAGFNAVGDFGQAHKLETGSGQMMVLHALMGGLAAEARGESFSTGAVAAGLNEAVVKDLDALVGSYSPENREALLSMSSQLLGLVATVAQDPTADAAKLETGAWVAKNSTQYNHELHRKNAESFAEGALDFCKKQPAYCGPGADQVSEQDMMDALAATAAHGQGIEKVKPEALRLVNQFLANPDLADTLRNDLFSPSASEQQRLDILEDAELAAAGISTASLAKAVLAGGGQLLSKVVGALKGQGAKVAQTAEATLQVPGRVQSRVNLRNGSQAEGAGWNHLTNEHYSPVKNKSQFTVLQEELRQILQSKEVVNTPITKILSSADGPRYVREVDLGRSIGTDKFNNFSQTTKMTVLTDEVGNLVSAFPGVLK